MENTPSFTIRSNYHSVPPDLHADDIRTEPDFRAACRWRSGDSGYADLPTIRKIAGVGALGFRFGGPTQDDRILTDFLIKSFRTGIRIAPDFEIDCINFLQDRDFLTEGWTYDAAVICFIVGFSGSPSFNRPVRTFTPDYPRTAKDLGFAVSPRHTSHTWQSRLKGAGVRLCMTYGSAAEIGSRDLEGVGDFNELVSTTTSTTTFNEGWLAHPSFSKAYRLHPGAPLVTGTTLGKALHEAMDSGSGGGLETAFNLIS